jgi:hypothetical protein
MARINPTAYDADNRQSLSAGRRPVRRFIGLSRRLSNSDDIAEGGNVTGVITNNRACHGQIRHARMEERGRDLLQLLVLWVGTHCAMPGRHICFS